MPRITLAGLGDVHHALAVAHQDLHAQLVLELADLLADPGLGGMQGFGGLGQVQPALGDLAEVA